MFSGRSEPLHFGFRFGVQGGGRSDKPSKPEHRNATKEKHRGSAAGGQTTNTYKDPKSSKRQPSSTIINDDRTPLLRGRLAASDIAPGTVTICDEPTPLFRPSPVPPATEIAPGTMTICNEPKTTNDDYSRGRRLEGAPQSYNTMTSRVRNWAEDVSESSLMSNKGNETNVTRHETGSGAERSVVSSGVDATKAKYTGYQASGYRSPHVSDPSTFSNGRERR